MSAHRAGVVALLGRPNAGKSTLLNAVLGEKLAIVTPKPQTTRSRLLGIHTTAGAQILFVDTPGLHPSERTLNAALNAQVEEVAEDCDVALLLVDLRASWGEDCAALRERIAARGVPVFAVGTRLDLAGAREAPGPPPASWPPPGVDEAFRVSSVTGEGLDALVAAVTRRLPASPPLYPAEELSDRPLRFLVAELVREAAFCELEQELPYALAVEVEGYDESRPDLHRIRAKLIVERPSQKQIAIGRGGERIKAIGSRARREIERLVGTRVHLDLWVKVERRWTKKPARIRSLGYV